MQRLDGDPGRRLAVGVWLHPATVAAVLGVSPRTVRRLAESGDLTAVKFRGALRIREDSVKTYVVKQLEKYRDTNGIEGID